MKTREFNIGDIVWTLQGIQKEKQVTCPDCLGNKYLTVVMGDTSLETIDCSLCSHGWQGTLGFIIDSSPDWHPLRTTITRKEQKSDGSVEYGCGEYYRSEHIYETQQEAEQGRLEVLALQRAEYLENLHRKERPKASWASNVRYHRQEIRDLTKRIEYHQVKLDVAKRKSKDKEA